MQKKAQLAAKPTTEYLLSRAKELASGAEKSYGSRSYEKAIDFWKKSLEEYERARELAGKRDEKEIVEKLTEVMGTINENIYKAEMAIDNRDMLDLVNKGNTTVEEANRLFEEKKFDESKKAYDEAMKLFKEALELAEKRDFTDDKNKIEDALESIESSIEAVLLSKCDDMLKFAEETFEESNFPEAETNFSKAIEFITGVKIEGDELEEMLKRGREGKIRAMIGQGKEKMQAADQLFKDEKHYDAKEGYKASLAYLEDVRDETIEFKLPELVEELNNLILVCSQNISEIMKILVEVEDVGPVDVITVNSIEGGTADFRGMAVKKQAPVAPMVKKLMEKYSELSYLGRGGFADVYKATRKGGTVVAVKLPRDLDEKTECIFFRELDTWKKLNHRNIVRFIEPSFIPVPHFEIEYLDGGSLNDALKSGLIDVEKACRIAFDIASSLEYAHNKYTIHGDINPKNILLSSIGEAKITDFGLAKISTSHSGLKGYTPPYASLEMLEKETPNEKSDVYQLGLTFYVMLTGNNPFDTGSRYDIEERIKTHIPDPPSKDNYRIKGLDSIIMRSLSKDPEKRPSLREFREHVYEFMNKNYNESLHLTEDVDKIISITCGHAMMAAKIDNTAECLKALNFAKGKVRNPEIRQELKVLIEQLEFRAKNEISLDQLLEKMEIFLKKVEWEG